MASILASTRAARAKDAVPKGGRPVVEVIPPGVEEARQLFVYGTALAKQHRWREARAAFTQSWLLRPHPVVTYNLAFCEESLGHWARAYRLYHRSLAEHAAGTTGALPPVVESYVRSYLPGLEARLVRATVRIESLPARLSVDGRPLEEVSGASGQRVYVVAATDRTGTAAVPGGSFEILADGGRHTFVVSVPEHADSRLDLNVGGDLDHEIVLAPGAILPHALPPATKKAPESSSKPDRTAAWISFAAGGASLVTAGVFGALAMNRKSYLDDPARCPTPKTCSPEYRDDIDRANTYAAVATIALGGAAVGAALGTFFWLTSNSASSKTAAQTRSVDLVVSPTGIVAVGWF